MMPSATPAFIVERRDFVGNLVFPERCCDRGIEQKRLLCPMHKDLCKGTTRVRGFGIGWWRNLHWRSISCTQLLMAICDEV